MKKIFLILLMCLFIVGCSKKGKEIELSLNGNVTTGYEWTYSVSEEGILTETQNEYLTEETELVGAGGVHVFSFKGEKEGKVTVTFVYSRSWEKEEPLYTLEYEFEVNAKKEIKYIGVSGSYSSETLPEPIFK